MSDIKFQSSKNSSPKKFVPLMAIGAGVSLLSGAVGAISAGVQKRKAERKEAEAREEMNRLKEVYSNLDTSNPFAETRNRFEGMQNRYAGMENTMEDLTINQKEAEFQAQQFQQSQANILGGLREAAGGSGIASLAQAMAQQGQLSSQRAAASIGQQEAANQAKKAAAAGRLQEMEARGAASVDQLKAQGAAQVDYLRGQGDQWSKQMEFDKQGTLLNMAQQETAAYQQQAQQANQAKWDSISSGINNALSFVPGIGGVTGVGGGGGGGLDQFGNVAGPDPYTSSINQPWMDNSSNTGTSTLGNISIIN